MKNKYPLVSIIIPCYNHEQFVQDSIQSVIDQTYGNIELLIIDDGSKDGSVIKIQEMIEACKERFVRFEFRYRGNIGLSATLNEALEWCEGKYFSPIASDDQILSYKTNIQVQYLETNNDSVAVFGGVQLIDKNNRKLEKLVSKAKSYSFEDIIMHSHNLLAPTQMIRKEAIDNVGGYNSNLFIEDWYMWLKLSEIGNIHCIDEIFAFYRQHDNNMSKKLKRMQQGRLEVLDSFRSHILYEEALININWYNEVEWFLENKNFKGFFDIFRKNPKKIIILINQSLRYRYKRLLD